MNTCSFHDHIDSLQVSQINTGSEINVLAWINIPLAMGFFSTSPAVSSILSLSESSAFSFFWISSSLFTISGNEGLSFGSIWDICGGNKNIKTHQDLNLQELHVLTSILRMLHCPDITVGQFHVVVACLLINWYEMYNYIILYKKKK